MVYPLRLTITNPSFESGTAPGTGWVTVNGTPAFGTVAPVPDPRGGSRYLTISSGGGAGSYRVRQDIAVPAGCLADVDAGLLSATMRFLWANYGAGNDIGFVEIAFLNGAGTVLATVSSGTFADSPQAWTQKAHTAAIPATTRTLRLILGGTWASGTAIDSYFDLVEADLVLATPPAGDVIQVYAESIGIVASGGRLTQAYAEALIETASPGRIVEAYAELIRSVADKPTTASGGTIVCIVAG
jgi:hypothetical protein